MLIGFLTLILLLQPLFAPAAVERGPVGLETMLDRTRLQQEASQIMRESDSFLDKLEKKAAQLDPDSPAYDREIRLPLIRHYSDRSQRWFDIGRSALPLIEKASISGNRSFWRPIDLSGLKERLGSRGWIDEDLLDQLNKAELLNQLIGKRLRASGLDSKTGDLRFAYGFYVRGFLDLVIAELMWRATLLRDWEMLKEAVKGSPHNKDARAIDIFIGRSSGKRSKKIDVIKIFGGEKK